MQTFFSDFFDTLDFVVIFVSFIVTTIYCFIEFSGFTRYLSSILMTYINIKIDRIPFN